MSICHAIMMFGVDITDITSKPHITPWVKLGSTPRNLLKFVWPGSFMSHDLGSGRCTSSMFGKGYVVGGLPLDSGANSSS